MGKATLGADVGGAYRKLELAEFLALLRRREDRWARVAGENCLDPNQQSLEP